MHSIRIKINYKEFPSILAVLLATLYFVIGGIYINGGVQIVCFLLILFSALFLTKRIRLQQIDFLWLISLVPFTYCITDWNVADIRDFVAYLAFVVFIICTKIEKEYFDKAIKLLFWMSVFHLFFVFLNVLFKSQFTSFIYSILDSGAISTYNRVLSGNYYAGFGYIPGDTSGYLVNGIILLVFGNILLKNKHRVIYFILLLIGIMFCAKRSHMICLALTFLITYIVSAKGSKKVRRIAFSIMIVVLILSVAYVLMPFFSNIPMISRVSVAIEKFLSGEDYTSNRTGLSNLAIQIFNENKLFGAGWKSFNTLTFSRWGNTNYVNNVFLQLAAETGIVGVTLFVLPMVFSLISTIRKLNRLNKFEDDRKNYLMISLGFQLFFLLYCFFEIPFYDYTFLFIYAIAIAISNSINMQRDTIDGRILNARYYAEQRC